MKSTKLRKAAIGVAAAAAALVGSGASAAYATTVSIDGGTWQYGETYTGGAQGHECYSYYHHPTNYHGAFSQLGSDFIWVYRDANIWAYTSRYGLNLDTCSWGYDPTG